MTNITLIDVRVAILVSDPWDFGTECGVGPFTGTIKDYVQEESDIIQEEALVVLDEIISYKGATYNMCICNHRHQGKYIINILKGKDVPANISLISQETFTLSNFYKHNKNKVTSVIGSIEQL